MRENIEINIAYLFPQLLDLYGASGDILTLKKRLQWRHIIANIHPISPNENIDYSKYDIYYLGGGQEKDLPLVSELLLKHKHEFQKLAQNGTIMLGICGGYQLLGKYYKNSSNNEIKGLEIFDSYTISQKQRFIGNVTLKTSFLSPNTIVGFENHTGMTYLGKETSPLGEILIGQGNNAEHKFEGAIYNNVFGTYVHGPLLAQNHIFADYLIQAAIRRKIADNNYILPRLDDDLEILAHKNAINKKY